MFSILCTDLGDMLLWWDLIEIEYKLSYIDNSMLNIQNNYTLFGPEVSSGRAEYIRIIESY